MLIFGWLGFALLQVFYVPQTVKMLRTRNVEGLSLTAWGILFVGLVSYVIYSFWIRDIVFIAGNIAGVIQTLLQIGLILKYRKLTPSTR